jgi:hypothetical protein
MVFYFVLVSFALLVKGSLFRLLSVIAIGGQDAGILDTVEILDEGLLHMYCSGFVLVSFVFLVDCNLF